MTEFDKLKLAIDDIRARQKALADLIIFTDQQAMNFLRLYVTLGLAAASGAVTGIFGSGGAIPPTLGWALVGATVSLLLGAWYCFKAMETVEFYFSGRGPEFWEWALHEETNVAELSEQYLKGAEAGITANRKLNTKTAGCLKKGRRCGAWAPVATLFVGLIAYGAMHPKLQAFISSLV